MTKRNSIVGGNILENLHRYITENHLGHNLPDAEDGEPIHQPYQNFRSAEDYRKDLGYNISLGSSDSRPSAEGKYDL